MQVSVVLNPPLPHSNKATAQQANHHICHAAIEELSFCLLQSVEYTNG